MITAIEIERLRGIRKGTLSDLAPLTVLVGPSGAGKSTVLDAFLIAGGSSPGDGVGRAVRRRAELAQGGPWLFERMQKDARIQLRGQPTESRTCELSWSSSVSEDLRGRLPQSEQLRGPVEITSLLSTSFGVFRARTLISTRNVYVFDLSAADARADIKVLDGSPSVRLVEPAAGATHSPINRAYTGAANEGRLASVVELIREALDGARDLRVLTIEDESGEIPILHIDYGTHTVPVAGSGSGIYALVRLALDLASMPGGLALVEEPEIHQHPSGIHRTAKVLLAAARRGIQVVVSTHSLDLVDSLLTVAEPGDLDKLCVTRVVLDGGELRSSVFSGRMVETARNQMGEDLR